MSWLSASLSRYRPQSDPLKTERRLELVVVVLAGLLLLQVAITLADLLLPPDPEPVMPTADSLTVASIEQRGVVNGEQSAAIRARPLFFASRRPEAQPEVAAQESRPDEKQAKTKRPDLKVVGVFGVGDEQGIIALHKNTLQRLYIGDAVDGWTLDKAVDGRATLSNSGDTWTVALKRTDTGITAESKPEPAEERTESQPENAKPPQTTAPEEDGLVLGGRR